MQNYFTAPYEIFNAAASLMCKSMRAAPKLSRAAFAQTRAAQYYWSGIFRYTTTFMMPTTNALSSFANAEKEKLAANSPADNLRDYSQLSDMNMELAATSMASGLKAMNSYFCDTVSKSFSAWLNTFEDEDCLCKFADRLEEVLKVTVQEYPKAIDHIKTEFGIHPESGGYKKVAETERFDLLQVLPNQKVTESRNKPVVIIPPYVLGANILAFLPQEQKSYVHCYANQGIPTYIRVIKDIDTTPAVQTMTGEDDARDIRFFCEKVMGRHNTPVTLNGFCQGGYQSLVALLSGELDGLVDALITCVSPIDGSRSKSLVDYIKIIPNRFRDIKYSQKDLPDGNSVIDGPILSWVHKLRKLETESPVVSFHRDIAMFDSQPNPQPKISKTAAAINYWLTHDQVDIPVNIAQMSFDSYSIPIDKEGNLPVTLFGRKLNLKRLPEMKVPWLICVAEGDDLVDKEAALAALDYIDAEVCVFPKGHAAIATSWSIPTSSCALHTLFPRAGKPAESSEACKIFRGPVRFQIDLDTAMEASRQSIEAEQAPKAVSEVRAASAGAPAGDPASVERDRKLNALLPVTAKEKKTRLVLLPGPVAATPSGGKPAKKTQINRTAPKRSASRKPTSSEKK